MYRSFSVRIPETEGKITISRGTYVLYEIGREYNREKQYNVPKRVTIGKVCEEEGLMYPNDTYYMYFGGEEKQDVPVRSSCLKIGAYVVIEKIIRDYGLDKIVETYLGKDAGLLLDLVAYMIITEGNSGQYYPDYAFNHPLFSKDQKIVNDSKVSSFLKEMSDEARIGILDQWNEKIDHKHRIYLSYDSTNKNCQAGQIEIAEYGHAKDDPSKPIVNYAVAYDHTDKVPAFYEEYAGSIVDISQLDYMIRRTKGYGYKNIGFILDRGYFCRRNLQHLDEQHYPFVIMARGTVTFIRGFVKQAMGTFEADRQKRIRKYRVYGTTIHNKLFEKGDTLRYIHVYYNDMKGAVERENLETEIDRIERMLKKMQGTARHVRGADRYFELYYDKDGILTAWTAKNALIEEEKRYCGYFVIVTSKKMTAQQALYLYKSRDEEEKLFLADKSFLGNGAYRVTTEQAMQSKMLIEFLALIVRNKIFTSLDAIVEEYEKRANYLTVPAAIRELEKIEMIRYSNHRYQMTNAVTATQKVILGAFGIKQWYINASADKISTALAKIDKKK